MNFYKPDFGINPDNPFARDSENKLVRKSYWLDMTDESVVLIMTVGIGKDLTNEQKRLHLEDIKRIYLLNKICTQEILPKDTD